MEFELYRLKNWGGRPNEACFPEGFPPYNMSTLSQPQKDMVGGILHAAQKWRGCGLVPRDIIQVPHLPPISLHKSIKNQTIYETTLPLSNLVDQVIQVKLMTGWWRGCWRKGKDPRCNKTYPRYLERSLGFELATS